MHRFRLPAGVTVLALVAAIGILATTASSSRVVTKTITPSPGWSAAQLSAPAGDNWLEYYGGLSGDRYSSLSQITTSNVSTLKDPRREFIFLKTACSVLPPILYWLPIQSRLFRSANPRHIVRR